MSRPRSKSIPRAEYLTRTHEFALRGEALPQARLNPDLVRQIRGSGKTSKEWAEQLGVHIRTIDKVRAFKSWATVQ
jgi:hypothetical protein